MKYTRKQVTVRALEAAPALMNAVRNGSAPRTPASSSASKKKCGSCAPNWPAARKCRSNPSRRRGD